MKKDIEVNGVMLSEPEAEVANDLIKDVSDTVHSFQKHSVQYFCEKSRKSTMLRKTNTR